MTLVIVLSACAPNVGQGNPRDVGNTPEARDGQGSIKPRKNATLTDTNVSETQASQVGPLVGHAPDLQHMPLYPNATKVKVDYHGGYASSSQTQLDTSDTWDSVSHFYADILPKLGWRGSDGTNDPIYTTYIWERSEVTSTEKYSLNIGYEVLLDKLIRVHIVARRGPDATKIPVLADAQQISVTYRTNASIATQFPDSEPLWERVTSYKSKATPEEVEAFYRLMFASSDWEMIDTSSSITAMEGISFRYEAATTLPGDPPSIDHGKVQITAAKPTTEDEWVEVKLIVTSTDMKPPR